MSECHLTGYTYRFRCCVVRSRTWVFFFAWGGVIDHGYNCDTHVGSHDVRNGVGQTTHKHNNESCWYCIDYKSSKISLKQFNFKKITLLFGDYHLQSPFFFTSPYALCSEWATEALRLWFLDWFLVGVIWWSFGVARPLLIDCEPDRTIFAVCVCCLPPKSSHARKLSMVIMKSKTHVLDLRYRSMSFPDNQLTSSLL